MVKTKSSSILAMTFALCALQVRGQNYVNEYIRDSLLSEVTENDVQSHLVGAWLFTNLEDLKGNQIDTLIRPDVGLIEVMERPDYVFCLDGTYKKKGIEFPDTSGTWEFDPKSKELHLKLDRPIYSPPIEKVAPSFIEEYKRLIAVGAIKPIEREILLVETIEEERLVLLEVRAFSSNELTFYRAVYRKNL